MSLRLRSCPRFSGRWLFLALFVALSLSIHFWHSKLHGLEAAESLARMSRSLSEQRLFTPTPLLETIHLPCDQAFNGNSTAISAMKKFTFDDDSILDRIVNSVDRCGIYRSEFAFDKTPPSQEELNFPLAYAVLAHNGFVQLLFTLSSFYESHNLFCLSVPSNADQSFIHLAHGLVDCFPNIFIHQSGPVKWGSYEIMRVTYDCMELMDQRKEHGWKYFQYLSGIDVPLRTNLEMVRVLKEWNGLSHTLTQTYQTSRLYHAKAKPPVRLFKSSLSALISREAAHSMITLPLATKLIDFLRPTAIADESFWASALGNRDVLPIPGAFDGSAFIDFRHRYEKQKKEGMGVTAPPCVHPPCISRGFVARHQIWVRKSCRGRWTNGSCVFGLSDLPSLIASAAFVAHKLYLNYEPAALFCMLKENDRRRSNPNVNFDFKQYNQLPQIELLRGATYDNLSRYDLIL